MNDIELIVSDAEIAEHHFGNFGEVGQREIVNEGVLKAMLGYSAGSTVTTILLRHKLITKQSFSRSGSMRLTKKGMSYARMLFFNVSMRDLAKKLAAQGEMGEKP